MKLQMRWGFFGSRGGMPVPPVRWTRFQARSLEATTYASPRVGQPYDPGASDGKAPSERSSGQGAEGCVSRPLRHGAGEPEDTR